MELVLGVSLGSMVEALALHTQEAEVRHVVSAVPLDEVASVATRGSSSRSARSRTLGVRSLGGEREEFDTEVGADVAVGAEAGDATDPQAGGAIRLDVSVGPDVELELFVLEPGYCR
jgi:hypothetical protein